LDTTKHKCQHCDREFSRESTLLAHLCEPKRRFHSRGEKPVLLGLQAYIAIKRSLGQQVADEWQSFENNSLYRVLVKFGRYCVSSRVIAFPHYVRWLLAPEQRRLKIDYHWSSDKIYEEFLLAHTRREDANDAVARATETMQGYSSLANYRDYFRYLNANLIVQDITAGRVTAWTVLNCASGHEFVARLDSKQQEIIYAWIDPDYWPQRFRDYAATQLKIEHDLQQQGL